MTTDTHLPDLDAYFARIGYKGPRQADLATLHAITAHHAMSIPFENVDVLLGKGIDISPAAVEAKLVGAARGGYCFEQNQLLLLVLKALGFNASSLSARVRWLAPREFTPPRTHLFVRVEMPDGPWITDVGVGGCSLTAALRWEDGLVQTTPHDQRRLVLEGNTWFHQVRFSEQGEWMDVCEFTGESMPQIDRDIGNYWTSTNPESKFRKNLILSRPAEHGKRLSLLNTEFTVREVGREPQKRLITSHAELEALLRDEFQLTLAATDRFPHLGLGESD